MVAESEKITPPGRFAATLPIEGRVGAKPFTLSANTGSATADPKNQPKNGSVAKTHSKALRKRLTGPEAKLWSHLKRIKTIDTHFRKQVTVGPYIADFACLRARLIVEIDGEQHGRHAGLVRDERRTRFLESQGFMVLRFWNHDVLQQMETVLDTIYAKLHGGTDAIPRSASKRHRFKGRTPSSPSMGEVARSSGPEGVTKSNLSESRGA